MSERNPVLIARTDPDATGKYRELYMSGFRNGPAHGFIYEYNPNPGAPKNRKKIRVDKPLYELLLNEYWWKPAGNSNMRPSLWNPDDNSPMADRVNAQLRRGFYNVQ